MSIGRPKGTGRPMENRFWSRVEKTDFCWLWTGPVNKDGYGHIGKGGAGNGTLRVHRYAYELLIGIIKEGMQIDHVCHTKECGKTGKDCLHRRCVNPAHLVQTTHRNNSIRDECTNSGKNVVKTHCPSGHEYSVENTRYERTRHNRQGKNNLFCRKCRECDRIRQADRRKR